MDDRVAAVKENERCARDGKSSPFLIHDGYPGSSRFDEKAFLENWHPAFFMTTSFLLQYARKQYRYFEGDLVMALVMWEIWQYNVSRFLDRSDILGATTLLQEPESRRQSLSHCNTHSISQSLGIPNETVRRKINKLVERGWIERGKKGEIISTLAFEKCLEADQMLDFMRNFLNVGIHTLSMIQKQAKMLESRKERNIPEQKTDSSGI